jgi:membrane protease YdiL (CAAX protease family)
MSGFGPDEESPELQAAAGAAETVETLEASGGASGVGEDACLEASAEAPVRDVEEASGWVEPAYFQVPVDTELSAFPLPSKEVSRTPDLLDAVIFLMLLVVGLVVSTCALALGLYLHWFGKKLGLDNFQDAAKNTPIALGTQGLLYGVALVLAIPLFRIFRGKPYFVGLHWHGSTAYRRRYWLVLTAIGCNLLAVVGNWILPFPQHAPIDQMFSTTSDAWLLAGFGVLVAPFFEEMLFRGYLLPAAATAWDWCREKITNTEPHDLDPEGNPMWSMGAMIFAALTVSAPFALMHAAQVAKAWGPLALLYCVSLVLCAVRLKTRSLAASTLVHSAYNSMLFLVMFIETGGFRHMDKM